MTTLTCHRTSRSALIKVISDSLSREESQKKQNSLVHYQSLHLPCNCTLVLGEFHSITLFNFQIHFFEILYQENHVLTSLLDLLEGNKKVVGY